MCLVVDVARGLGPKSNSFALPTSVIFSRNCKESYEQGNSNSNSARPTLLVGGNHGTARPTAVMAAIDEARIAVKRMTAP